MSPSRIALDGIITVRRPDEWGAEGPSDPNPDPHYDIIAYRFPDLARRLGVQVF